MTKTATCRCSHHLENLLDEVIAELKVCASLYQLAKEGATIRLYQEDGGLKVDLLKESPDFYSSSAVDDPGWVWSATSMREAGPEEVGVLINMVVDTRPSSS